jgi:hypothetical protein
MRLQTGLPSNRMREFLATVYQLPRATSYAKKLHRAHILASPNEFRVHEVSFPSIGSFTLENVFVPLISILGRSRLHNLQNNYWHADCPSDSP